MDDVTFYPAATIALLVALNVVLVACLVSNRAAAAAMNAVRRPVGWIGLTAGMALAIASRAARQS
jgi:hypothetical protein